VPKKTLQEKEFTIKLPEVMPELEHDEQLSLEEKLLPPSFEGKLVQFGYQLQVYVKHDAWNEWGRGKIVNFPIKIHPKIPDNLNE